MASIFYNLEKLNSFCNLKWGDYILQSVVSSDGTFPAIIIQHKVHKEIEFIFSNYSNIRQYLDDWERLVRQFSFQASSNLRKEGNDKDSFFEIKPKLLTEYTVKTLEGSTKFQLFHVEGNLHRVTTERSDSDMVNTKSFGTFTEATEYYFKQLKR